MPGKPKTGFLFTQPWEPSLCREAIDLLGELSVGAKVLEIGGGASTLFLYERADSVYTLESDVDWGQCILDSATGLNLSSLRLVIVPIEEMANRVKYTRNDSFDLIFIDCHQSERWAVIKRAAKKVKPGGTIIIDDTMVTQLSDLDALFKGWKRTFIEGTKAHPVHGRTVKTATKAFRRPE